MNAIAGGWAALSNAWGTQADDFVSPLEAVPPMRRAVERALALDPSSAEAHAQAGVQHMCYDWDPVSARRELERALALDSTNVTAATYYSLLLSAEFAGLGDSSAAVIERGVRSNPGSASMLGPAIDEETLRRLSPTQREQRCLLLERLQASPSISCTVRRLRLDGRADSARRVRLAALRRMTTAEHEGLSGTNLIIRAEVFLGAADTASARIELNAAIARSAREYVREDVIAGVYFRLGDIEHSVQWWERAVDSNGGQVLFLLHARQFEPLRRDPRAQDVIRRARARQRS